MATKFPIAVELLKREAQSLRGYDFVNDWRTVRAAAVQAELTALNVVPQVYVNYSSEDGGLDVTVTRGEAEVIEMDWDGLNSDTAADDYTVEDLAAIREKLSAVAAPAYRARLLADLDEVSENLTPYMNREA